MLSTNLRISGRKKSMLSSSGSSENLFSSVRAKGVVNRLASQVVQPATPAVARLGKVDADRLRQDADLQQAAGAVEGDPGALEPLQAVVDVEVEDDLPLGVGQDHGCGVLAAGGVPDSRSYFRTRALTLSGRTVDGQQDIEHVAADDPQRTAHVGGLVEVLGQVLADERGAAGADRDDVADEPLVEQLPGPGHGLGEAHVVADLRDRPGRLRGRGQAAGCRPPRRRRASRRARPFRRRARAGPAGPCPCSWSAPSRR